MRDFDSYAVQVMLVRADVPTDIRLSVAAYVPRTARTGNEDLAADHWILVYHGRYHGHLG